MNLISAGCSAGSEQLCDLSMVWLYVVDAHLRSPLMLTDSVRVSLSSKEM